MDLIIGYSTVMMYYQPINHDIIIIWDNVYYQKGYM